MLVGGLLGLLIGAVVPDDNAAFPVPSAAFMFVLLFLSMFGLIPALALLRTWKRHVLATFLIFFGLFGFILPNLVVAAQN